MVGHEHGGGRPGAGSERRDEILAIAAQLFAERGFAATTVREIADAAGILSGSLYHHFDSKESMVDELVHEMLDRVTAAYRRIVATGDDPEQALRALVREAFAVIATDPATVAVMVNEWNLFVQYPRFAYLRDIEEETERLWVSVIERGATVGRVSRRPRPVDALPHDARLDLGERPVVPAGRSGWSRATRRRLRRRAPRRDRE